MPELIHRSDENRRATTDETTTEETTAPERDDRRSDAERSASESSDRTRVVLGADQRDVWLAPGGGAVLGVN